LNALFYSSVAKLLHHIDPNWIRVNVFNATSNNISVISWWSDLLVEENEIPGEKHQPNLVGSIFIKKRFRLVQMQMILLD
jgi:hypothetical protein